mgnify:CR=1 FL=1
MLSEKALLVRLSVKYPSFSKTDKGVSLEVADQKNANQRAVKVIKTLIDTTHPAYRAVKTARGALFPSVEACAELFHSDVEVRPVPEAGDFRVAMSAEDKQKIVTQMQRKNDERVTQVTSECFDRAYSAISNMVERLEAFDPDKKGAKLYDSLVGNVRDIADLLPSLNVGDDPRLEQLAKDIGLRLTETDASTLKKDEGKRQEVADNARQIMNQIDDFIGQ